MSNDRIVHSFVEAMKQSPLVQFSVYTHLQVEIVDDLGSQILEALDAMFTVTDAGQQQVDAQAFRRVYGMYWLWILGAYEVTRTMCQARTCFSEEARVELSAIKTSISGLRMAFAKQEIKGQKTAIGGEASVSRWDHARKDLGFHIDGGQVSMRETVEGFRKRMKSIKWDDVTNDHRSAYVSGRRPTAPPVQ